MVWQRYQTQLKLTDASAKDSLYFILRGLGLPLTGESFGTPRWLHLLRRNHRWDMQSLDLFNDIYDHVHSSLDAWHRLYYY